MIEDAELLRRYVEEKSEPAFAALVQRHVNFVYACALRRVGGDTHRAEDVTQQVFTALARNAAVLARREVLSGWLYTTTRNAAAQVVRGERRRQTREQEAHTMTEITFSSAHDAEWERLRPVLDDAMDGLGDDDRQAVLLRFFEGKSFADVGERLRLPENTARMRVERALDKLHAALARRGVTSTSAALAVALANQAGVAAPAGLAAAVTGAALAGATVGVSSGLAAFMSITKLQIGIASAVTVAGATAFALQAETNSDLRREIAAAHEQQQTVATLRAENQRLTSAAAEVEVLRRDDVELKQLAQSADEVKKANAENARRAVVARAQDRRKVLEDQLREQDRLAQAEVDRMNREGNALVVEFKGLTARAKDESLAADARAQVDAAAKMKMAEIQAKQREIKDFIENTRRALMASPQTAELRALGVSGIDSASPSVSAPSAGRLELRRSAPDGNESATPGEADHVSMRLPQVDQATALAAYEKLSGVRILRDPSIGTVAGALDFQTPPVSRAEASQALRSALRDQLNIVLEPGPDGILIAKLGPPR